MVTVKLFVEGGGNSDALKTECRRALTQLLEKAPGCKGKLPRVVACGPRKNAYDQFCCALKTKSTTEYAVLLVDAECPVAHKSPWQHVAEREGDQWKKPSGATDEQLHLMVECMESWFLADRAALAKFYGQGFNQKALPSAETKPEKVSKADLYKRLKNATTDTKTQGEYGKGQHSFKLLATLDPKLIKGSSPWAERFFEAMAKLPK
ncbi:MAG: DUF4276 family protein [Deltaproteobacteria bacterium]|nr:DUF4276 family protein [Deltaproteobacteria bacterium]